MGDSKELYNDWRLSGQDKYLDGVELMHTSYDENAGKHDHCEFCTAKFSINEIGLHQGYCSLDKYHWICETCFNDFKTVLHWRVV